MTEPKTQLMEIAARIRTWQIENKLSDNELLRRYAGLGSTKTYTRILTGNTQDLDLDKWIDRFASVETMIQAQAAIIADADPVYDDLLAPTRLKLAFLEASQTQNQNRLILVQGTSGSGKTAAARVLLKKYPRRCVYCEANETWRDNLRVLLEGLLGAVGAPVKREEGKRPPRPSDMLERLVALLNARRLCLVIDEAHHLGARALNVLKSLINRTPGEIVLLAMDTLWRKLEMQSYQEARQLIDNRLCGRIVLTVCPVDDVRKIIRRRLELSGKELDTIAAALADKANRRGRFALVNLVVREALRLAEGAPITGETIAQAVSAVEGTR